MREPEPGTASLDIKPSACAVHDHARSSCDMHASCGGGSGGFEPGGCSGGGGGSEPSGGEPSGPASAPSGGIVFEPSGEVRDATGVYTLATVSHMVDTAHEAVRRAAVMDSILSGKAVTVNTFAQAIRDHIYFTSDVAHLDDASGEHSGVSCSGGSDDAPLSSIVVASQAPSQDGLLHEQNIVAALSLPLVAESGASSPRLHLAVASGLASDGVAKRRRLGAKTRLGAETRSGDAAPPPCPLCRCKGNCGGSVCKKSANVKTRRGAFRQICKAEAQVSVQGGGFCQACACETQGCCGGRQVGYGGDGRFCSKCSRAHSAKPYDYRNKYGCWKIIRAWSQALRRAAAYGYMCDAADSDDDHWFAFLRDFFGRRDAALPLNASEWMFIFIVANAKWPAIVRRALGAASGMDTSAGTAEQYYALLVSFLEIADGNAWNGMLRTSSPKRIGTCTGLVYFAKKLGAIAKLDTPSTCGSGRVFRLGATQTAYVLEDPGAATQRFRDWRESITSAGLDPVPAAQRLRPDGCEVSAAAAGCFLRGVSSLTDVLLASACGSKYAGPCVKRRVAMMLEILCGQHVWDDVPMTALNVCAPDVHGHVVPLLDLSSRDVRRAFGVSPLHVSGRACLWGMVPEGQMRSLDATASSTILRIARGLKREYAHGESVSVTPADVAALVSGS